MQNAELQRKLCVSQVMIFYISINDLYFFNPARRPQSRKGRLAAKTGRGKGGLLCAKNLCIWFLLSCC